MRLKFLPSFVKRRGRITNNQEENLKSLPDYSINTLDDIEFHSSKFLHCCLEIGFGNAEHLFFQAINNPEVFFIGSEVYMSGIGTLIGNIQKEEISNIKIFPDDIRILLDENKDKQIFDAVKIICPDPWPKERHHKRRLINADFLKLLHNSIKADGNLYISTDWADYAESIKETLDQSNYFESSKDFFLQKESLTKFEQRGKDEGREIFEFNFQKKD